MTPFELNEGQPTVNPTVKATINATISATINATIKLTDSQKKILEIILSNPRIGRSCLSILGYASNLQPVSHAAAAFFVCLEDSFVHETLDFAEGSVVAGVE